jgi:hypothetical protein
MNIYCVLCSIVPNPWNKFHISVCTCMCVMWWGGDNVGHWFEPFLVNIFHGLNVKCYVPPCNGEFSLSF